MGEMGDGKLPKEWSLRQSSQKRDAPQNGQQNRRSNCWENAKISLRANRKLCKIVIGAMALFIAAKMFTYSNGKLLLASND